MSELVSFWWMVGSTYGVAAVELVAMLPCYCDSYPDRGVVVVLPGTSSIIARRCLRVAAGASYPTVL